MPGKHAICSASSSERWIQCPPSAKLNAAAGDMGSTYAQQGTDAHSKCEYLLRKALGQKAKDPTEDLTWYNQEMEDCCEAYRDFVLEQVEDARQTCSDPFVGVEQRLDYSRWVPEGAGTGDCVIVADDLLHIIDFKYGVGVPVSADHNSQLMCYALAALDTFDGLYTIRRVRLSIFQPRRENVNTWETTVDELLRWADEVLAPAAKLAYAGEGEFHAGDHCRFCRIRETCRARAEYNMELMRYAFEEPAELSNEEIADILPKIDSLTAWAADVKDYALQQALNGATFPGFKVVEGRSNRKYTDEAVVASIVQSAGYDPYEKKVLGITAMTKALGKKKFEELLGGYITKPRGKPVLAAESDARPEYTTVTNDDFDLED